MKLRLNGRLEIENLHGYPEPLLHSLRQHLRQGVTASPDPKRRGFYDLVAGEHTFYIYVPQNGQPAKKLLLAHWTR